jgi:predicted RNase H-like HicB family nuclease
MSWDSWRRQRFHIRFQKAEEGGYIVSIPEMPGCVTQAESFAEGLVMIQDALQGLLQVAVEHGDPIPEQFRDLVGESTPYSVGGKQAARSQAR